MTKTILTILLIMASAGALALEVKTKRDAYAYGILAGHCFAAQKMAISAREIKDPVVKRHVAAIIEDVVREYYPNISGAGYVQVCKMHFKLSERILMGKEV